MKATLVLRDQPRPATKEMVVLEMTPLEATKLINCLAYPYSLARTILAREEEELKTNEVFKTAELLTAINVFLNEMKHIVRNACPSRPNSSGPWTYGLETQKLFFTNEE